MKLLVSEDAKAMGKQQPILRATMTSMEGASFDAEVGTLRQPRTNIYRP